MNFDIELVLVIGSFLTGVIWLLDILVLSKQRVHTEPAVEDVSEDQGQPIEPWYVEYAKSFFPVLIIVLILRSFVAEPFRIPSGSMMPTLLIGDFILVNKFSYGIRLPVLHTKVVDFGEPERGDVVVFRYPLNPSTDYIKRIVGLPGDHITFVNKQLYVNGVPAKQELMGEYIEIDPGQADVGQLLINENLNGIQHDILVDKNRFDPRAEGSWIVPMGHYFAMGDNRDNSNDSRFWGMVPEANLVGKAFMIWMNANVNFDHQGLLSVWTWSFEGSTWEPSRIGNSIQ
jgi:signal peptidase I